MENELREIMEGMLKSIASKEEKEYGSLSKSLAEQLKESPYKLSNPENFDVMFLFPLRQILEKTVRHLHKPKDRSVSDSYKPQFIYLNYSYLKHHIENLLDKKRGTSAYSADISRYLLRMYLEYSLTGSIPEDEKEHHYWIPNFGTNKQWMNYCDSLYQLFYGNTDPYFEVYLVLLQGKEKNYE